MQNLQITPATLADAAAVSALHHELGYTVPPAETANRLRALAATGDNPVLLLRRAGEPVGLLALHRAPSLAYPGGIARIMAIVIARQARGEGLGRHLVAHAEAWARAAGCDVLELTSGLQRQDAHAFYRRLGFAETSLRFRLALG